MCNILSLLLDAVFWCGRRALLQALVHQTLVMGTPGLFYIQSGRPHTREIHGGKKMQILTTLNN